MTLGTRRVGKGKLILNALDVLSHVDRHPASDLLLLNLVRYALVGGVSAKQFLAKSDSTTVRRG